MRTLRNLMMKASLYLTITFVSSALCFLPARAAYHCSITHQGNQAVVTWPSELGKTYALIRSDELDKNWQVVSLKAAAAETLSVPVPWRLRVVCG